MISQRFAFYQDSTVNDLMSQPNMSGFFEVLNLALMLLGLFEGRECSQVAAFAGGWILLAGVESEFPGFELPYHDVGYRCNLKSASRLAWRGYKVAEI